MNRHAPCLLALLLLSAAGCSAASSESGPASDAVEPRTPLIIIGVDGMEWDVVLPMLHEGRLPNIAALMEGGAWGLIDSTQPTLSPCIWTSIATGRERDAHGVLGFLNREGPDASEPKLYTSLDRRTKAFWNMLDDRGGRSVVIGWWNTFPVEAINGVMVAQTNVTTPEEAGATDRMLKGTLYADLEGQVHPPSRRDEILAVVPEIDARLDDLARETFGGVPQTGDPIVRRLWDKCMWAVRADAIYQAVALELLADKTGFDVFAVYFGGPDVFSHRFWRYLDPDGYRHPPTEQEVRDFADVIPACYARIDRVIGELVAAAPQPCNVMIVSDHGFGPVNTDRRYTADLSVRELKCGGHPDAPPGFFVARGPDIEPTMSAEAPSQLTRDDLPTVGSVLDVAPTVLALMNVPVGRDMDGAVMTAVVRPSFFERHPVTWVDTHTPPGWFETRRAGPAASREAIAERIEQLRSLGYLGGGDGE